MQRNGGGIATTQAGRMRSARTGTRPSARSDRFIRIGTSAADDTIRARTTAIHVTGPRATPPAPPGVTRPLHDALRVAA